MQLNNHYIYKLMYVLGYRIYIRTVCTYYTYARTYILRYSTGFALDPSAVQLAVPEESSSTEFARATHSLASSIHTRAHERHE